MMISRFRERKIYNVIFMSLSALCAILTFLTLSWIFSLLIYKGISGLNISVFTDITRSPFRGGGLLNSIVGSAMISTTGLFFATPIGVAIGVYLAEYDKSSVFSKILQSTLEIMIGIPAILYGLFIYQIYVAHVKHFSGWAGSFAVGLIMIPIIARSTQNIYDTCPPF